MSESSSQLLLSGRRPLLEKMQAEGVQSKPTTRIDDSAGSANKAAHVEEPVYVILPQILGKGVGRSVVKNDSQEVALSLNAAMLT
jgi:hypothetical protein